MRPLTESEIRESMVNAPAGEAARMPMPGLHEVIWDEREFLGWRDPQAPQRGYVVFWNDDEPVGLTLRAAESQLPAGSAMCSLCQTLQPASQVRMFSARRAGEAGERGNSVGTYICADLGCSTLIRMRAPGTELRHDPGEVVAHRAAGLTQRLASFTERVVAA
ncbi:FBP domain-containing protein [Schumannella sp. 10F1B-5-1]|uniref:FBP domain-containing protein n=1 Tax=Schumannella sp. 10F1B-5-1 TaxID=2590780 RepID=UPI001132565D|nr:FBP domain-containing protein [Schumannella sp. 10F1B-5-1]TPW70065.1 FBP domain-containing protein [Schumannella sp. 10F1B-5-1]